jgi:hypothetical protein
MRAERTKASYQCEYVTKALIFNPNHFILDMPAIDTIGEPHTKAVGYRYH